MINSHLLNPVVGTKGKVLSEFFPLQGMAAPFLAGTETSAARQRILISLSASVSKNIALPLIFCFSIFSFEIYLYVAIAPGHLCQAFFFFFLIF